MNRAKLLKEIDADLKYIPDDMLNYIGGYIKGTRLRVEAEKTVRGG